MTGQYVGIIAFLITFGVIVIVIHFVGILADKIVDAVSLGFLNRILGMVFGLIKTVLILSVIFSVLNAIDARKPFITKEENFRVKILQSDFGYCTCNFPGIG